MKKIITAFVFCFLCGECFSQAGEWVWIKGDSVPNQPGNYGVQGVPSPTNNPPSLYEPCEWTDLNGNFWLFGGFDENIQVYSDLWKYNPATNEWTWMRGTGLPGNLGNYGIQGIPSPTNYPPVRGWCVASWTDNQGDFWMFGGSRGYRYSDLWKYTVSTNEWVWMKGPTALDQPGIYGTKGVSSPNNNPGGRMETAAAWVDNSNNLWLFGGDGFANSGYGYLNDLWKYDISSNQWTWMKGDSSVNSSGIYGTQGVENIANTPGARYSYCHWKDFYGNLWLFGGAINGQFFNDLWRYNITTNCWGWWGGNNLGNGIDNYGLKCISSSSNIPGGRFENRTSWTNNPGNFLFFGGWDSSFNIRNDLWSYCVLTNQWVWLKGDSVSNPVGNWGIQGNSSPTNKPDGRGGAIGWKDNNGNFFLFGGCTYVSLTHHNDLWKYTIDTACGVCPSPNSIEENNLTNNLVVFPNPTSSSLTISFSSSQKQNIELRIYNTLGKQVYFSKQEIITGKFEKEINVEKLSDGIYFLQVKTKEGLMSRKLMVQH